MAGVGGEGHPMWPHGDGAFQQLRAFIPHLLSASGTSQLCDGRASKMGSSSFSLPLAPVVVARAACWSNRRPIRDSPRFPHTQKEPCPAKRGSRQKKHRSFTLHIQGTQQCNLCFCFQLPTQGLQAALSEHNCCKLSGCKCCKPQHHPQQRRVAGDEHQQDHSTHGCTKPHRPHSSPVPVQSLPLLAGHRQAVSPLTWEQGGGCVNAWAGLSP